MSYLKPVSKRAVGSYQRSERRRKNKIKHTPAPKIAHTRARTLLVIFPSMYPPPLRMGSMCGVGTWGYVYVSPHDPVTGTCIKIVLPIQTWGSRRLLRAKGAVVKTLSSKTEEQAGLYREHGLCRLSSNCGRLLVVVYYIDIDIDIMLDRLFFWKYFYTTSPLTSRRQAGGAQVAGAA